MASFVVRALDVAGARIPRTAPDAFADDHGSVHESAINRLAAVGVIAGTGPSSFSPGRSVTRAQMATFVVRAAELRSEEHTSELQSLMRISYAVFCLNKKKNNTITPSL